MASYTTEAGSAPVSYTHLLPEDLPPALQEYRLQRLKAGEKASY